jgi:squalene-hopene/tetraprenyl-beta-curcumene cyclase
LCLQNADGGWPTFCRGWGTLPFDRSGTDLTAHAIRALNVCKHVAQRRIDRAIDRAFAYIERAQRADGAWVPLWFGNEHEPNEENPVYGTARVLLAYRDLARMPSEPARRGAHWLVAHQNDDGGWSADPAAASSVEETAVATEALLGSAADRSVQVAADKGLAWLVRAVAEDRHRHPAPIGFYFARLWYYEAMYPLVFATSALSRANGANGP